MCPSSEIFVNSELDLLSLAGQSGPYSTWEGGKFVVYVLLRECTWCPWDPVEMQEQRLVEAGNVFRSITRTERAHCTLNTHRHTEHVFPMSGSVWENWSAIQYEVIYLGVRMCMYSVRMHVSRCVSVYAECSELSSHSKYPGVWRRTNT